MSLADRGSGATGLLLLRRQGGRRHAVLRTDEVIILSHAMLADAMNMLQFIPTFAARQRRAHLDSCIRAKDGHRHEKSMRHQLDRPMADRRGAVGARSASGADGTVRAA